MKNAFILFVAAGAASLASPVVFAQGYPKDGGAELLLKQQAEAQSQEAAKREEMADAILAARQTASGREMGGSLRASLKQSLLSLPLERLEAFLNAGGLGDIEAAVREAARPQVLGDAAADLAFTPVSPCRIVDTRSAASGLLVAGTPQSFVVRNAGGFAGQGGSATDCGIPATATSVEMNYVAVGPAGPGDLRAFAFGGAVPNASVLNYATVSGLNIANGIAQPVCNPATTTCTKDLTVQADVSNTHLIVDVVGYFNKINKAQVKSFVVTGYSAYTTAIPASPGCINYQGGVVTVNAPVAGTVLVRANVILQINQHTVGVADVSTVFLSTANNDCTNPGYGFSSWSYIPPALPTDGYYPTLTPFKTFNVSAGSTTFYLNGFKTTGAGVHNFYYAGLEATFIPN